MTIAIYVDANVFITAFETAPTVAAPARELFKAVQGGTGSLVTSDLTIAEVLAPASTPGSLPVERKAGIYRTVLLWGDLVRLIPVTRAILLATIPIRADHRQKLPDAIHIATALHANCRFFCSSDHDLRRLPLPLTSARPDAVGVRPLIAALQA